MPLHRIHSTQDPLCALILDDPVRPEIPIDRRVGAHSEIFVLLDDLLSPGAVVCVYYVECTFHQEGRKITHILSLKIMIKKKTIFY